jgi:hypothetical protein
MKSRAASICAFSLVGLCGCFGSNQEDHATGQSLTEGASYSSPEQQQQLKTALAAANIPYQIEMRKGEEFVNWDVKDSAAAKAALESPLGPDIPGDRNVGFSEELREEFEHWLKQNHVSYFTKSRDGRTFIVWSEKDDPEVRGWLRARLPEPVFAATMGRSRSSASGKK